MTRCFKVRTLKLLKTLNKQNQSFGSIIKLMVFRANGAEPKMSHAPFVILHSLGALHLELLLIFLVELFSDNIDRMLELLYQYVKMMIIVMYKSKMLREFSTKK